jgi:hypothetical protein
MYDESSAKRSMRIYAMEQCMGKDELEVKCDTCEKDPCICEDVKASSKRTARLKALKSIEA